MTLPFFPARGNRWSARERAVWAAEVAAAELALEAIGDPEDPRADAGEWVPALRRLRRARRMLAAVDVLRDRSVT